MHVGLCKEAIGFFVRNMRTSLLLLLFATPVWADVYQQGEEITTGTDEVKEGFFAAFNVYRLGTMMRAFYFTLKDNEVFFHYLIDIGDMLLVPLLLPLMVICTGARVMEELHSSDGSQDMVTVFYTVGAVVLILSLYRYLMQELVVLTNALAAATAPRGFSFETIMAEIEGTVEEFDKREKNSNMVASFINQTISLYTHYVLAWTSKWGVMIFYSLLSYLRKFLFAINYLLGIFLLPFLIVRRSSLAKNWFLITALLCLWVVVEAVMIAAVGSLGIAALHAAINIDGVLPVISESLFYIMIATVNILVGVSILTSIWIVKSYFLSPSAISTAMTLFSLPGVAMATMMNRMVVSATQRTLSSVVAGAPVRRMPRSPGRFPPLPPSSPKTPTRRPPAKPKEKPAMARPQKGPKRRAVIEYQGALPGKSLPGNVLNIARIGRKRKV